MTQNTKNGKNGWLEVIGVGLTTEQAAELRAALTKKLQSTSLHTTSALPKKQATPSRTTH